MREDKYQIEFGSEFKFFEFDIVGPKGVIRKLVQYTESGLENYFNLGFGDKNYSR